MNSIEYQDSYRSLDYDTKKIVDKIISIKNGILSKNKIISIYENLESIKEEEKQWYSFVVVTNEAPKSTLNLNIEFIQFCIAEHQENILSKNNIIFRFESGDRNAN